MRIVHVAWIAAICLSLVLLFFAVTHKCQAGHYMPVIVPSTVVITIVDNVPFTTFIPEHESSRWICECGGWGLSR